MKIDGKTIPAPQNIKRREAFLLAHADKLPKTYVQAQLLRIAMERAEKKLRWETPKRLLTADERMANLKENPKEFTPIPVVKKNTFVSRIKGMFKSQRGN